MHDAFRNVRLPLVPIGKQYVDFGVSARFVPEGEGSRTRHDPVIASPSRYRLIGRYRGRFSSAHWGGKTLSGIRATLRHASLTTRILDYSDFQL